MAWFETEEAVAYGIPDFIRLAMELCSIFTRWYSSVLMANILAFWV
jgi:hypothetical protein